MSHKNYKLDVISLILEKTFVYILNLEKDLDYADWCGLSSDLIITRDFFEKLKLDNQNDFNKLDSDEIDFESFWNSIESNIQSISSFTEANRIKQRLERLIISDSYLHHDEEIHQLSKQELEIEMEWIRKVTGTDDALSRLKKKLKICSDSRLNYALKLAINKLTDGVEPAVIDFNILNNLKSPLIEAQTSGLQKLIEQGCQASLALVGLFVFHQNINLRVTALNGLKQFKIQDILSLIELMEKSNSIEYRLAAEEIRKEFSD